MAPFGPNEAPPLLKWVLVLTDLAVAETFWQFFWLSHYFVIVNYGIN
jgi:hypothetical protein